jgi:hypothetical protein
MPRLRRAALPGFPAVGSVSANGAAGTGSAACHTRAPGAGATAAERAGTGTIAGGDHPSAIRPALDVAVERVRNGTIEGAASAALADRFARGAGSWASLQAAVQTAERLHAARPSHSPTRREPSRTARIRTARAAVTGSARRTTSPAAHTTGPTVAQSSFFSAPVSRVERWSTLPAALRAAERVGWVAGEERVRGGRAARERPPRWPQPPSSASVRHSEGTYPNLPGTHARAATPIALSERARHHRARARAGRRAREAASILTSTISLRSLASRVEPTLRPAHAMPGRRSTLRGIRAFRRKLAAPRLQVMNCFFISSRLSPFFIFTR